MSAIAKKQVCKSLPRGYALSHVLDQSVELAKKIGKSRYKVFLEKCNYGNQDIAVDGLDFWNLGSFAISPINQIETLIAIYEENLPFSPRSFEILKDIMVMEKTKHYTIRAKTGWTNVAGQNIGWWIGYIEKGQSVYFFATRLINDQSESHPEFGPCRIKITKSVLAQLGILD
ncbi:MAG: class D beta-lactamase [Cyclobacteriaceae bacterium]|nr:class D beta-lactamase [Cyclobacteriaceae bacterium HetDA_MAG_MS6]